MVQIETFGKYCIVRKLGRSMTDVYLADDTTLDRRVVLKIIEHSRDEFTQLAIEAEKRGALIQKQLHGIDSRILEVFDFGEQDGCFFVAMEYFAGKTLSEILQIERRLNPARAARYAAEMCSQLKTLHSFFSDLNGRKTAVVHGDIKPSNVQIGSGDELKLLDFGIAKVITSTHNLTRHNLGSPSYCSPERLSRAQVDPSVDLWAVGVTLYELLSGAPPYQAQDTRKLENLIQSRRPPRALPEDCPSELKAIVAKALASELDRRYQTAELFEADLRAFLELRPTSASRERFPAWNANATIERRPEHEHRVEQKKRERRQSRSEPRYKVARSDKTNLAIALLGGILAGLLLFMPFSYSYRLRTAARPLAGRKDYAHEQLSVLSSDWSLFQDLKRRYPLGFQFSPANRLGPNFHANLAASAENIIDNFRNSSDTRLSDFDWEKARLCLVYALQIDPTDTKLRGELALCDGYRNLIRSARPPKASLSIDDFRQAESFLPRSADPHLALARVYVYAFHNIGEASAEFHEAEQLGYRLGPREAEQQADGYLFRAQEEMMRARQYPAAERDEIEKWLQLAHEDIERARSAYEPITGFSNVNSNLQLLYRLRAEQIRLQTAELRPVAPKRRYAKRASLSVRKWR
jgi:serine/threonine protein kinase